MINGRIISGLGTAKIWLGMAEQAFYNKTKVHLFLGTLNIKLRNSYVFKEDFRIFKNEYGGEYDVLVKKCKIFDREAYIIRSEKNTNSAGDYGTDVLEIASDIEFRKEYNLKNGDNIIIEVGE